MGRRSCSKRLRIISLSVVMNEQDIIEPFVRHNNRFVDFMIIMDNGSNDDTRRIISDLAREFGNIVFADQGKFGHTHAERMTLLLHYCQTAFFADYVVLLDADEFIESTDRAAFQSALEGIKPGGFGLVPWRTFVLAPDDGETATQDPPRSMKWRRAKEIPVYEKAILRLGGLHFHDLEIVQGNHIVLSTTGRKLPCVSLPELSLAHFPVRSRNQLLVKSIVGWMAYLGKDADARQCRQGYQKRENFDYFVENSNFEYDFVCERSLLYAQDRPGIDWQEDIVPDEPPSRYTRKYSTGEFGQPISVIARAWEHSLVSPKSLLPPAFDRHWKETASSGRSPCDHPSPTDASSYGSDLFVDIPPFRFISEKYRPESVLEIGCGNGAYLMLLKGLGAKKVLGIDRAPAEATAIDPNEYVIHDVSKPLHLDAGYDLAICLELVEHLDDADAVRLLADIARHASGRIIFSAAEPGQPGHLHINCRPIGEWLQRWQTLGWAPDLNDSLAMRSVSTLSWLRRNLVVLTPESGPGGEGAIQELTEIGDRPFTWYPQEPGIREEILSEKPPQPPLGYVSEAVSRSKSGWLNKIGGWLAPK